jgi:ketosteroid isomerase-like protein
MSVSNEASNSEMVRQLFDAYAARDFDRIRKAFADDAVFHRIQVGRLEPRFRGPQAIADYLARLVHLTGDTLSLTPIAISAGGERVFVQYRISGSREGKVLDTDHVLVFTMAGAQIAEAVMFVRDFHALAAFWS